MQGDASGGQAWLTLTFTDPGQGQIGEYRCEVNTIDKLHTVTFESTTEVTTTVPTLTDVLTAIQQMKQKEREMQNTIDDLSKKVYFSAANTIGNGAFSLTDNQVLIFD